MNQAKSRFKTRKTEVPVSSNGGLQHYAVGVLKDGVIKLVDYYPMRPGRRGLSSEWLWLKE